MPGPDLRSVAAIVAIARQRSFKEACEAVHLTQPTLSRIVARTEADLGVPLFRRGWSGAETTHEGDIVVRQFQHILTALDTAEARIFAAPGTHPPLRTNLKWAHLQVVEAIVHEGSVSAAAQRLNRQQPDLSRTLSDFTKRFRLEPFRRSGTGMVPLPAALRLAELAGTIRHILGRARQELIADQGRIVGRVSVGMLPFSGQDLIPKVFARLTDLHPRIRLLCVPGSYHGLVESLRRREIDLIIGILRGPGRAPDLTEETLYDERFTIICRKDHPLRQARRLSDLRSANWIVAPIGTPIRGFFEGLFTAAEQAPPTQTVEMLSFAAAEQMIVESHSIAMLSYSPGNLAALRPGLAEIRIDLPRASAPIGLTRLADAVADPALDAFARILAEVTAATTA